MGTIVTIIFDKARNNIESETTLHNRTVSSNPPITVMINIHHDDEYNDDDWNGDDGDWHGDNDD